MAEAVKSIIANIASLESRVGTITLFSKSGIKENTDDSTKSVQHIRFEEVTLGSDAKHLSMSVADFRKSAEGLIDARTERVLNGLKRSKFAMAFVGLALNQDETIEGAIQSELEEIVSFLDDNAPESTSGPVLRKVQTVKLAKLADLLLILSETSGEVVESFSISANEMSEAYALACTKAQELGQDALGQFRIQKAKVRKVAAVTE